jgi:hypothetical protein
MKEKLLHLVHSITDAGVQFAKDNPRLVFKGSLKAIVASTGALAVTLSTHNFPVTGGILGGIAAGAIALDGYLSDSQGKGDQS